MATLLEGSPLIATFSPDVIPELVPLFFFIFFVAPVFLIFAGAYCSKAALTQIEDFCTKNNDRVSDK